MGLIFIFHQNFGKNMLPWQTMTICVKHFVNIPDISFNAYFNNNDKENGQLIWILFLNNLRKKKGFIWKIFIFHKNLGGRYVAMATTIKCVSKVLKFNVYSTNIISCKYWSNIYKNFNYRAKTKKMLNSVIFLQNNSACR